MRSCVKERAVMWEDEELCGRKSRYVGRLAELYDTSHTQLRYSHTTAISITLLALRWKNLAFKSWAVSGMIFWKCLLQCGGWNDILDVFTAVWRVEWYFGCVYYSVEGGMIFWMCLLQCGGWNDILDVFTAVWKVEWYFGCVYCSVEGGIIFWMFSALLINTVSV